MRKNNAGFVYVAVNRSLERKTGECYRKIGSTTQTLDYRLSRLNGENTRDPYQYVLAVRVSDCRKAENELKKLFEGKHDTREFYRFDDNDLITIINYLNGEVNIFESFNNPSIKYNTKEVQDEYFKKIFPRSNINNLNGISRPSKRNKSYVLNGRLSGAFLEEINGNLVIKKGSKFRPEPLSNYLENCGEDERNFCKDTYKNKIRKTRDGKAILKEDLLIRDINQAARIVTGSRRYNDSWIEIR